MTKTARRSGGVLATALLVEQEHIGLGGLEAALGRLAAGGLEVLDRAYGRLVDHLAAEQGGRAGPHHAAARPIDWDALAHRTAQELVDRDLERLALDVEAGVKD